MRKNLTFSYALVTFLAILFSATTAFAQTTGAGQGALCDGDQLARLFCQTNLPDMLNQAFQISISVAAILAMLRIGYAGYLYMGSADMWSSKSQAKTVFQNAVVGLLILLAIWLILHQINPDILKLQILQSTATGGTNSGITTQTNTNAFTASPSTPPVNNFNQNTDAATGNQTINNGCSSIDCQSATGLGPTPGIPF